MVVPLKVHVCVGVGLGIWDGDGAEGGIGDKSGLGTVVELGVDEGLGAGVDPTGV